MQCPKVPELHVFARMMVPTGSRAQDHLRYRMTSQSYGIEKGQPVIHDDDFMIGSCLPAPHQDFIHNADKKTSY